MIWKIPRMWEDGDVWILGGGPSISRQFDIPDKIIQDVRNKILPLSAYSPYMSYLHDKHVIAINVAYLIGDWIDMVFFGDSNFISTQVDQLANFPGLKVACQPVIATYSWIKYVPRDTHHPRGITPNPKCVSWNGNSGAAAISLAAHAGAKRIILLGFDMRLGGNGEQHWHDAYNRGTAIPRRGLPYAQHLLGFPAIAKDAQSMGIEILNASPDSMIQSFKKVTVKELMS